MIKKTNNGKGGGLLIGDSHSAMSGGVHALITDDNNKPVLLEGQEVIINKKSVNSDTVHTFDGKQMTNKEILSEINSENGNGVPIYKNGGMVDSNNNIRYELEVVQSVLSIIKVYVGGEYAGYIRFGGKKNNYLYIKSIEVYPKYRKQGIATDLYRQAYYQAKGEGLKGLYSETITNDYIYKIAKNLGARVDGKVIYWEQSEDKYAEGGTIENTPLNQLANVFKREMQRDYNFEVSQINDKFISQYGNGHIEFTMQKDGKQATAFIYFEGKKGIPVVFGFDDNSNYFVDYSTLEAILKLKKYADGGEVDTEYRPTQYDFADKLSQFISNYGYFTKVNYSKTDFGISAYVYISNDEEDLFIPDRGFKVRISDHSVSNIGRMMNEYHIQIPIKNEDSVLNGVLNEIRFIYDRDKYFTYEASQREWYERLKGVNEKQVYPKDKIIEVERISSSGNKMLTIDRYKYEQTVKIINKSDGTVWDERPRYVNIRDLFGKLTSETIDLYKKFAVGEFKKENTFANGGEVSMKNFWKVVPESSSQEIEQLIGGVSDGKYIPEIAEKHGVDESYIEEQIRKGINVEMEHTDARAKAEEIAKDHLWESAEYYEELEKMEGKLKTKTVKETYNKFFIDDYVSYNSGDMPVRKAYGIIKKVVDLDKEFAYRIDAYVLTDDGLMFDSEKTNEKYEAQLTKLASGDKFNELKKEYEMSKNTVSENKESQSFDIKKIAGLNISLRNNTINTEIILHYDNGFTEVIGNIAGSYNNFNSYLKLQVEKKILIDLIAIPTEEQVNYFTSNKSEMFNHYGISRKIYQYLNNEKELLKELIEDADYKNKSITIEVPFEKISFYQEYGFKVKE